MSGQDLRTHLADVLAATAGVGTVAGFCDGLATLSRNIYVPHFALLCVTAPIVLTTAVLVVLAVPLAIAAKLRRWSPDAALPRIIGLLVGLVCELAALLWWARIAGQAVQGGGGGLLFYVLFLGLAALAAGAGVFVGAALERIDPFRLRRWLRRSAAACATVNVLVIIFLSVTVVREGRRFLFDPQVGPVRGPGEMNVLLITIDTLRADRLASFGAVPGLTPHLDQLAAQGVAFTTAVSQSPWTLPSIASIFTGLTPGGHGAGWSTNGLNLLARTPLPAEVWTFTQALRKCGYLTQAFVTNPYLSMRYGFGSGFDRYENITMESEAFVALGDTVVVRLLVSLFPDLVAGDIGAEVTARAIPWLERHRHEKFFLWLHYLDPHAPYGDPRVLGNKSFRSDTLLAEMTAPAGSGALPLIPIARLRAGEVQLDPAQRRQLIGLYDAGVRYDDEQVGHVLRRLDRLGLRDQTLVIVASDHGEEFWEHGGVEHGHTLYEELVRVPLIVRWPGGRAGQRVADVVRLMDIAPTVTDLSGCQGVPEEPIDAQSLRPLLLGRADPPRAAVSHGLLFAEERRALRTGRFKYIEWANGKEEAYDLESDPGERRDLAAQAELVAALRTQLQELVVAKLLPSGAPPARFDSGTRELLRVLGYGH